MGDLVDGELLPLLLYGEGGVRVEDDRGAGGLRVELPLLRDSRCLGPWRRGGSQTGGEHGILEDEKQGLLSRYNVKRRRRNASIRDVLTARSERS